MFKALSITAGTVALVLALTGCAGGDATQTLKSAKQVIKEEKIACESASDQKLADVLPQNDGNDIKGDVLFCQDEGAVFGMGIFENPKDIGSYINLVCGSSTDDASITQLKEYEMLWGPNWFIDASSNPDLYSELQSAFGGELADFYSKCPAE